MSLFGFSFKPRRAVSAQTAKDRLQILLAHERSGSSTAPEYLSQLQSDIVAVIRKYVKVEEDGIDIRMEPGDKFSSLEINIEVPADSPPARSAAR